MRFRSIVLLALLGCGKTNPVTPAGTVLVDWDASKASRAEFAQAKIGARTGKDYTVTVTREDTPPFKLDVHVDVADVELAGGGGGVQQRAPVAIKVTVKENTGWDLSGKPHDGPNFQMPGVGADGGLVTPLGMMQTVSVSHHRYAGMIFTSSWQLGFTLTASGDGTVRAFPDDDVKIE